MDRVDNARGPKGPGSTAGRDPAGAYAISARFDTLEQEFEERRRARNGMQATTEHEAHMEPENMTVEIKILSRKNTEVKDK